MCVHDEVRSHRSFCLANHDANLEELGNVDARVPLELLDLSLHRCWAVDHVFRVQRKRQHFQHHHDQPCVVLWGGRLEVYTTLFHSPAVCYFGDAIQCSSSAQHDQDEVRLHGLCRTTEHWKRKLLKITNETRQPSLLTRPKCSKTQFVLGTLQTGWTTAFVKQLW